MVYDTENYWIFGLYPSSGILKTRTQRFGNWMFPSLGEGETPTLLGTSEKANLNHWTIHILRFYLTLRSVHFLPQFLLRYLLSTSIYTADSYTDMGRPDIVVSSF
jgi:hypothetical protein